MIKRLAKMPYAKAEIHTIDSIEYGMVTVLRSYNTYVACIACGKPYCSMLYSRTSMKHISAFAREYGFTYEDFKQAYLAGNTHQFLDSEVSPCWY